MWKGHKKEDRSHIFYPQNNYKHVLSIWSQISQLTAWIPSKIKELLIQTLHRWEQQYISIHMVYLSVSQGSHQYDGFTSILYYLVVCGRSGWVNLTSWPLFPYHIWSDAFLVRMCPSGSHVVSKDTLVTKNTSWISYIHVQYYSFFCLFSHQDFCLLDDNLTS